MIQPAAIGIRAHSGWAAVVAVSGSPPAIQIIARRRIEVCEPSLAGVRQPYHYVQDMDLEKAGEHLAKCSASSQRTATTGLRGLLTALSGYRMQGVAVLEASGHPLPPLAGILASHALIHTAEGEFFREVFRHAARALDLAITGVRERDIATITSPALQRRIDAAGKSLGPPWTRDQKLAALAACVVLNPSGVPQHTVADSRLR